MMENFFDVIKITIVLRDINHGLDNLARSIVYFTPLKSRSPIFFHQSYAQACYSQQYQEMTSV
jgi:hypothetical protein